jgi:molecular chaperone DnaK
VERIIGIDLGTTNSVVAYTDPNGITEVIAGKDGDRVVPSVVYFPAGQDPVVGSRAKQHALVEPERVATLFKRGMGERTFRPDGQPFVLDGKTWLPEELSSLVLKKLVGMAADHFGEPVRRAVITVPAYFGEPERTATRTAGELAGLDVFRIVNEPTAAAFAHGMDHLGEARRVLVFDLGGGTFDVTIMDVGADGSLVVVATGGDRKLGGADFDRLIVDQMAKTAQASGVEIAADPWSQQDAYAKAEEIKKDLSSLDTATRPITAGGRPIMFTLTRADFDKLIRKQLQGVEDITLHTIDEAGLQPTDITTVLMVGGSSRVLAFQALLARVCGQDPTFSRNLDEDVARGAAILGTKLSGDADPRSELAMLPAPRDVTSQGLGVTVVDGPGRVELNQIMIPGNTAVPHTSEMTFSTVDDGQSEVDVRLNEGDDEDMAFVRELSHSVGRFARPVRRGHPIRIEMEYTAEQLIRVRAYDGESGGFLCDLEVRHDSQMSDDEKRRARNYLTSVEVG